MANMSYCRFENTYHDLKDCAGHIGDRNLSESESRFRAKLIDMCRSIVEEADNPEFDDGSDDNVDGDFEDEDEDEDEIV